ncbi:unnamed protein product [Pieris brassicae]|uniref:Uncharacterized protein n=1 Tax=Pieris brassicae TaxID=7116 RepID=A0A9P0TJL8_PIEBR|nr:unnamed protein product [Pieris brassicae]
MPHVHLLRTNFGISTADKTSTSRYLTSTARASRCERNTVRFNERLAMAAALAPRGAQSAPSFTRRARNPC